jgi:hypothetical protein
MPRSLSQQAKQGWFQLAPMRTPASKQTLSRRSKNGLLQEWEILIRLLVRAWQVTDEILCLLENGFADGAMARWRTLHEIHVVAAVLMRHGESITERYLAHQAVESKRISCSFPQMFRGGILVVVEGNAAIPGVSGPQRGVSPGWLPMLLLAET